MESTLLPGGRIDFEPTLRGVYSMSEHECGCGGSCSCNSGENQVSRVYLTREEYVARLEQYLVDLKTEIKAVEEELVMLRQEEVALQS
jgi:hypothetical protein